MDEAKIRVSDRVDAVSCNGGCKRQNAVCTLNVEGFSIRLCTDCRLALVVALLSGDSKAAKKAERRRAADIVKAAVLGQVGWENRADVVTLDGQPVGGTITNHRREFDRWWPEVQRRLAERIMGEGS